jgi:hypothetical protein
VSRFADSQPTDRVHGVLAAQREHLRALVRRLAPKVDADEVVQTTAERALARAAQVRDPDRAEAWVASLGRRPALGGRTEGPRLLVRARAGGMSQTRVRRDFEARRHRRRSCDDRGWGASSFHEQCDGPPASRTQSSACANGRALWNDVRALVFGVRM